ncbi:Transposase, Ptta/En/Spm, plant [Corchorus olitorius]|uniref:Transposase, Ptta/En/Spm, plant n=1 Tax=Corchorus olitorius TaxID=93759 RepID=A0A1R3GCP7_9ROSI|nr:Transposase, Ptta/En/Spm, plant [Corchorus olitorius]
MQGYYIWSDHGECESGNYDRGEMPGNWDDVVNPYQSMIMDCELGDVDFNRNGRNDETYEGELPNPRARKFFELLKDADEPLWAGCKKHSKLSAVSQLLTILRLSSEMKKPSGENPTHAEVFERTHTRRNGEYVDPKSKLVIGRYVTALKEKHGEGSSKKIDFDPTAWKFAVGETGRGHLYGFGSFQNPRAILEGSSR